MKTVTTYKLQKSLRGNTHYAAGRIISLVLSVLTCIGALGTTIEMLGSGMPFNDLIAFLTGVIGLLFAILIYSIPNAIYDAADAALYQRHERYNDEQHAIHEAWKATQQQ